MKKLTVCIDMDDTIEYLLPAWLRWLNSKYNLNVKVEDITEWDITRFFPSLTLNEICEPLNIPEFWDTVTPMSDAIEYIPKLIKDGHEVFICTSTNYKIAPEKFDRCLFKHFPFIDKHNVIITYNKQMIDCDILVDDAIHNLVGGKYLGLLMYMPHNKKVIIEDYRNIYRVHNWKEIYEFITEYSNCW